MELNHLRCFYEVARAGGFSFAARKLSISQSALSKAVALLESRQEVTLLERSKRGVSLTPLGEEVYSRCQIIFGQLQNIKDLCADVSQKCEGPLRFGSSDHIARYLLLQPLKKFSQSYPQVAPSLFVGAPNEVLMKLLKNEIEFGLFFTRVKASGIVYKRIAPFESVLVSAENVQGRNKLEELLAKGIVGSIAKEFKVHPSRRIFEFAKIPPPLRMEVNSQELQKHLCISGQGSALLAKFMVREEITKNQLHQVSLPKRIFSDLLLVHRKNYLFTKPAQNFIDEVVLNLKDA